MKFRAVSTALCSLAYLSVLAAGPVAPVAANTPFQTPNSKTHGGGPLSSSTNWSGYAAPGTNVTDVRGNWTVPSVSCSSGNQYSSVWVGIDGYNSGTVEQLGTEQDCQGSRRVYSAWYEMYPNPSVTINMTIHAGDQMFAEVHYNGSNQFTLTLQNLTTGARFSINRTSSSARRTSAEWVVEAPSSFSGVLPLANFGTAYLTNSQATINGRTGTISAFSGYDAITMVTSNGTVKSQPSGLSNGGANFNCVWHHR